MIHLDKVCFSINKHTILTMQTAPIPKTLQDVRPLVRNMRPDGYILQTGGSATRQVIAAEGDQVNPLFRVTGVPLHTHNASALLEVEVTMATSTNLTKQLSYAGEFSELDTTLELGEHHQPEEDVDDVRNTFKARMQRSIDWGIGRVELRPENSVNYIRASFPKSARWCRRSRAWRRPRTSPRTVPT